MSLKKTDVNINITANNNLIIVIVNYFNAAPAVTLCPAVTCEQSTKHAIDS